MTDQFLRQYLNKYAYMTTFEGHSLLPAFRARREYTVCHIIYSPAHIPAVYSEPSLGNFIHFLSLKFLIVLLASKMIFEKLGGFDTVKF